MSNYLAVATVTASIGYLLAPVKRVLDNANITFKRPSALDQGPSLETGINVYMCRTATDPFFRNADLPTRSHAGGPLKVPTIGLGLDYLLTFYGDDTKLEPQRMLGWAQSQLHAQPVLEPDIIARAVQAYPVVAGSDLERQVQRVTLAPLSLSLEEISRFWSAFYHAPYLLSVVYRASVVLVNPELTPPPAALPVITRRLHAVQLHEPSITAVTPSAAEPGSPVVISGTGFTDGPVQVVFANTSVEIAPDAPDQITCAVPLSIRAGATPLRVVAPLDFGTPEAPERRPLRDSNTVSLIVQPHIVSVTVLMSHGGPLLVVEVQPLVYPDQAVSLWLQRVDVDASELAPPIGLECQRLERHSGTLRFDRAGVPSGTYLVWLQVDHARSSRGDEREVVIS